MIVCRMLKGILVALYLLFTGSVVAQEVGGIENQLEELVRDGEIIGAQVAIQKSGKDPVLYQVGTIANGSEKSVDDRTLFLIASCSKPFASLCVLDLINDPTVDISLDSPINHWLPAFGKMKLVGGGDASRAPTVEELLSHRAGIYSQKTGMTKAQAKWIRSFDHDLTAAVDGIAAFPLVDEPGSRYAYSGAGYCVLGRVAEVASRESFEVFFQERVCEPLGLTRTTFFPARRIEPDEIATGFNPDLAPHRLGEAHRMPLIGGSLYSTASEMVRFGQAVYEEWRSEDENGPYGWKPGLIQELGKPRSQSVSYSLGWSVSMEDGKAVQLSHSGALYAYRAWIAVDLETGTSIAGCWTLAKPGKQPPIIAWLKAELEK